MRFRANDWLVHPQHGVGQVVRLEIRQFGPGTSLEYYEIGGFSELTFTIQKRKG